MVEIYTPLITFSPTLVMIWATFLTLVFVLKHIFWDKVLNFMEKRANEVKETFDNADRTNKLADEKLADYEERIANVEAEAREIIKNAKARADSQAKDIVDDASQKAAFMLKQAEEEILRQQQKAVSEMHMQIAALAILAAEKVLEKKLDVTGQEEIISNVIEQAGSSKWQM